MVQGQLEISARKNPLEVYRKSPKVPPADSARKNPLEVSRKSARVTPYTTVIGSYNFANFVPNFCIPHWVKFFQFCDFHIWDHALQNGTVNLKPSLDLFIFNLYCLLCLPLQGSGDILFFPLRLCVCLCVCP